MDTDRLCAEPSAGSSSNRADAISELTLHERLVIAGLLAGVTLWIRVGEVIPHRRRRS